MENEKGKESPCQLLTPGGSIDSYPNLVRRAGRMLFELSRREDRVAALGLIDVVSGYFFGGFGEVDTHFPLPPGPTHAAPGTEEKIQVMRLRFERRQQVMHPFDARHEGDSRVDQWWAATESQRKAQRSA